MAEFHPGRLSVHSWSAHLMAKRGYKATPPEVRFWKKVRVGGIDDCWHWLGAIGKSGHGHFSYTTGQNKLAHRYAFELANGPIKNNLSVCHKCNNPVCVNPKHLRCATRRENNKHRAVSRPRSTIKSGVTGVYWDSLRRNWKAAGSKNNQYVHLYQGSSLKDAITARRSWELECINELKGVLI